MKKYFFGYLFVRIAKLLAVFTVLAGVGYALFRMEQASIAAQSASYQPNLSLKQSVVTLAATLADAQNLVSSFCSQNGGVSPAFQAVNFSGPLNDNYDLTQLSGKLEQTDQERRQLKEALVTRFEALIEGTETKLRAHAAQVAPVTLSPPTSPGAAVSPVVTSPGPTPGPTPSAQAETLYTGQITNYDIQQRTSVLDRGKDLLKVLESAAEDPKNRKTLIDAVSQLDALSGLLPEKIEAPAASEQPVQPLQADRTFATPAPRPELNAEKVADQLARLRISVRQAVLTEWTLDAAYAQTTDLAASESARCRVATLTVKGIWLAAFGQLGMALLVAIFAAFLVLVLADFMQTLLDTATNTGLMASANRNQP